MKTEEEKILSAFEQMQQAMIDKDAAKMRSLVAEDKTFTHMSGKKQTKEEYFEEILNGTLNYYGYEIHDLKISVNGDKAILKANVRLKAKVYGMSGSWTVPVHTNYKKTNCAWIQCN